MRHYINPNLELHLIGVAFKKGRCDDIPDILNDILKQMIDDGTIKKIAESYGINADISMGDN